MEEHACNSGGEYRRGRSTRPAVANEVANKTIKKKIKLGVVAHAFNTSTREAEAGGFLSLRPAWSTK